MAKKRVEAITDENLDDFYSIVETTIDHLGLKGKPQNIYNCDETNFTDGVFASKTSKRLKV